MPSYTSDASGLRAFQAAKLVQDGSVWVAIGKTSPWNEGETVPVVTSDMTLQETVAFKRADQIAFVVKDDKGTIEQRGQKWRILKSDEAKATDCRHVYVQAWLNYDEFPLVTYRQTGVYAGLVLKSGVAANEQVVTLEDIVDVGYLLVLNNRSPIQRDATQKESLDFIIEF
ncbi:hypothetical protein [Brevibacillus dissolubilis]|uniref:hypothetical protein n=1 Tax=Brevibacillus dissolubilis TaxID=1844116 RepID=UPI0011172635|nr:hypothetical protein [Brevibacillus dissolubilis]